MPSDSSSGGDVEQVHLDAPLRFSNGGAGQNRWMKTVRVRAGKERSLLRRHPWVFEGSVASGRADAGETVRVEAADGRFLAWAAYSPHSSIRLRAWSFDESERSVCGSW